MSMDGYFSMIGNQCYRLVNALLMFLQDWLENAKVM